MSNDLSLTTLLPRPRKRGDMHHKTFVGIDFGTSTTVASVSLAGDERNPITVEAIPCKQLLEDGRTHESHLVPTVIAWYHDQLLIGAGAHQLKHRLQQGRNLWHSFKMELGTDLGPRYYGSELGAQHPNATLETPVDAATLFFRFLKTQIERYVQERQLPEHLHYAVSIPAAFEANQRRDLLTALEQAGIAIENQALIDEPNAAFLSYLAEYSQDNPQSYQIPEDSPLKIMVFDFGAGTCDISILEIGKARDRFYSRNLSISRFEPLGGNDIDKAIARNILLPQVLAHNALTLDDVLTPDINRRILPALLGPAETLKINLCKRVATNMVSHHLPSLATSDERQRVRGIPDIVMPKRTLTVGEVSLSYREFAEIMEPFLDPESSFDHYEEEASTISVFSLVNSALDKAELTADALDMVLMVGGSSQNPYVQEALATAMPQIEIERPSDMRSHVSKGAAIHAQLLHGYGVNVIQPITGEPVLYLTRDGNLNTLVPPGTAIPYPPVEATQLYVAEERQTTAEVPIFVSTADKLLHVIRIHSPNAQGFKRGAVVKLLVEITPDKLIKIRANVGDQISTCEYMNPFANHPLSADEWAIFMAQKNANRDAARNSGRPSAGSLLALAEAYAKAGKHLRAAETYQIVQQMTPNQRYEVSICYHYSLAGRDKLSRKWAEVAHKKSPSAVSAFNLALDVKNTDEAMYRRLMEEALQRDPEAHYVLLTYGQFLKSQHNERGEEMIKKAYRLMLSAFNVSLLSASDYSRLIQAANLMGDQETIRQVKQKQLEELQKPTEYSQDNLLEKVNALPFTG